MMNEWLDAWSLFAATWMCAWIMAPLLALVGVAVVARGAIFQGVATAQASTAMVAAMIVLAQTVPWCGTSWAIAGASMLVAISASVIAISGRSSEAANGWLFLAAGAATPLLLWHSPHGLSEVQHLVTSSLMGASWYDAGIFAGIFLGIVVALLRFGSQVRLVLLDREVASDLGLRVSYWQIAIGVVLGTVIGLGLRVAGLLFVAGCLLLPALAATQMVRTTGAVTWCAPAIALIAAFGGTLIAHVCDLPMGQAVIALLALLVAIIWLIARGRSRNGVTKPGQNSG